MILSSPIRRRSATPLGRRAARAASHALAAAAATLSLGGAGSAAQTPPAESPNAQTRLLAGPVRAGVAAAGIEIHLAPGWKTYWRYPGDSGVPPQVDWSRSRNVAALEMAFPAPLRFDDGAGGSSIGYTGTLLLPLTIRVGDPSAPARIDLTLDFAVCETLCTLAEAHLTLDLPAEGAPGAADAEARIAAARALVPRTVALAPDGDGPAILSVGLDAAGARPRLVVDARTTGPGADLFVEGPDTTWALPLPQKAPAANGITRFTLPLEGLPPGASAAATSFGLTLVDPAGAIFTTAVPSQAPR